MGKLPSRLQPWHNHVMKTKAQHPDKKFKEVLRIAKRTFKKGSSHSKSSGSKSSINISTKNYNIRVKSKKNRRLSKKVTRKTSRKASKKKSRRRKKKSFGLF